MDVASDRRRGWGRRAWKWAISAFLIFHGSATLIWVMPTCPVRVRCEPFLRYYILPLGLWHSWAMFAPEPLRNTFTLEADAVDARGIRYTYAFPRVADYSWWRAIPRFRHSKFSTNLAIDELDRVREVTARFVVRHFAIPAEAYPVEVHLLHQVRASSPPGSPPSDAMTPVVPYVIGTFHFDSRDQIEPR